MNVYRNCIFFIRSYFPYLLYIFIILYYGNPFECFRNFFVLDYEQLQSNLLKKSNLNITKDQSLMSSCIYDNILNDTTTTNVQALSSSIFKTYKINNGGEYVPENCIPQFSTAIVVPYRNRAEQLNIFLIYMHNFLYRQNIHYRIFIIEQFDNKLFNRAKLLNIGAKVALDFGFPCLILHDVDLLPLTRGNLYACTNLPRHMSANLDIFRFNPLYPELFGGIVAVPASTFKAVNGMSNLFYGWGGEDDDFYRRLTHNNIDICRYPSRLSRYTMMKHAHDTPSKERKTLLESGPSRYHTDGLISLKYTTKAFRLHPLFTHVLVEL